jgi:branched-chain amino acid transport system ATP-binding protein
MSAILQVRNLRKAFGAVVAADDITVTVDPGDRIGLIGTNGAGKTTFVNMVTGYLSADSGSIMLRGKEIRGMTPREITRAGVCRSFQIPQLFLNLTVEENLVVALGISSGKAGSSFAPARSPDLLGPLDDLLTQFRLQEFRNRLVQELPGGVRKLLDIAVSVTRKPSLLLLDEPTSGVAAEQKFVLMDIVVNALPPEVTVLFVEHDMEIIGRYSTRVLAFYDGRIISDGPPEMVLQDAMVRSHITGTPSGH